MTGALERALETSRVAHAYLFSGPRGCGKTTSARILARSLNCAEGPTPRPCGKCESCIELASGGPGSLDVMEIDAASNSGVDDARNLRERAEFAPVRDRYRIFILDEAHMVTTHGFNALLKLVEEPPDHVKFIFATTEPDKVITTIRSRTHHYPFRLVPPNVLIPYLQDICAREGVTVEEAVFPLVVRAGGGSVRDSLSVLDQLIAGSRGDVGLEQATRLLGFTDSALLDRAVEALGAGDGAAAFALVQEVVEAGHEPRRFVEDLLQRFRDLILCLLAGPENAADVLEGIPADQLSAMLMQADAWNINQLSASADVVEEALRSMTGATSPRLQLELLLARLLSQGAAPARSVGRSPQRGERRTVGSTEIPSPPRDETPAVPEVVTPPVPKPQPGPATVSRQGQPESDDGPTIDQVRAQWTAIQEGLSQRSRALAGLLSSTRHVYSKDGLVTFQFEGTQNAERFRRSSGELALGQVLSRIFGSHLRARVGTEEELAAAKQDGPGVAPRDAKKRDPSPVEESREEEVKATEPDSQPDQETATRHRAEQAVPRPQPHPDPVEPAAPPTEAVSPEDSHPEALVFEVSVEEPASEPADQDAKYASMLPVDRFLDIVGGQVVERTIEEPHQE